MRNINYLKKQRILYLKNWSTYETIQVLSGDCSAAVFSDSHREQSNEEVQIKSGTITFESAQKMAGLGLDIQNKVVVSFDDYGMRECRETYQGNELKEIYFSDGKDLYSLQPVKKAAFKRGKAVRGCETTINWNNISSDDKKGRKGKKTSGHDYRRQEHAESFEYTSGGETTTYAVWNHILMMIDMKSKQMIMLKKAVAVDKKTAVSEDKFKIPAGYTIK